MRTVKVTRLCYNIRIISCLILTITMIISGITINKGPFSQAFAASGIKIAAVGNWGCTSNSQATVNNINSKNPELVLGLGDYSYESTPDCWFNEIKAFDSKMKISIGNHDVMTKKLLNSYLNHFSLSNQYYSFDFQSVHVLTMATELEWEAGSKQYKFVKNDLEQVSRDPNIKWIIVTMHKPIYTSPNGCSASSCEGSKTLRDTYHPLFDNYGVDLVLEAHMHSYQRSYPIKYNVDNPSKPIITSSDKNNYNNPSGEIFAIVATGGINFHSLAGKAPFTATQQDSKFGILEMQFSNNKLDAKFVSNAGSTMDHFTVSKTTKKPTTSTPTITKPAGTPKV
ncbi:MAG: metallophosphoesterase, partial [Nitrososphaeraceae archaeon]